MLCCFTGCAYFWNDKGIDPLVTHEDGLPVFYLHPAPKRKVYEPAVLFYKGNQYFVEAKKRGRTSLTYPMNSFAIRFPDSMLFSDSELGYYDKKILILTSCFDDNSYIRQRFAFDVWNKMSPGHIQIQTSSGVVYLDGEYFGLYTVCESVDEQLMTENGLYPGGNLFKAVSHSANFKTSTNTASAFEKKEGFPEEGDADAFADLDDLIEFIDTSSDNDFRLLINNFVDIESYEDWWIFASFISANDSVGKNAYHYHEPNTELWYYIPWDFNASFGQNWKTFRCSSDTCSTYTSNNRMFDRFFNEPVIEDKLRSKYYNYLIPGGELELNWLLDTIDSYYEDIYAAAIKSEKKWRKKYVYFRTWSDRKDFTVFTEEIDYIKNWITNKHKYVLDLYD